MLACDGFGINSLADMPERCILAAENADFLSRCGGFCMAVSHISTACCLPSKATPSLFSIFGTPPEAP